MKKHTLLFTPALAIIMASCGSDSSKFDGYTRAENGLHYKFFNRAEGSQTPKIGDFVMLRWDFRVERNDSSIMDSKQASRDGSGYGEIDLKKSTFKGSLEDGILMMGKGDSASFIIPADSFFLKTMGMNELPAFIKKGDNIKASIKLGGIKSKTEVEEQRKKEMADREAKMKQMQEEEQGQMDKYIADNKITVKPTASGLIFIETTKGKGAKPKAGDIVEVNYTGRLLNGTVFDTSVESVAKENNTFQQGRPYEPIKFTLGAQQVIAGWDEGISMLSKGSKAKFVIPSKLAYGPNPAGAIPPFSTLVFEVELVNFTAGQQPGQAPKQ